MPFLCSLHTACAKYSIRNSSACACYVTLHPLSPTAHTLCRFNHLLWLQGPIYVRLAWHAAGTYDKESKTGGSNGATMRFKPEASWGANAGLAKARDRLEAVKKAFPDISYSDLWSLAGAC